MRTKLAIGTLLSTLTAISPAQGNHGGQIGHCRQLHFLLVVSIYISLLRSEEAAGHREGEVNSRENREVRAQARALAHR